MSTEHETVQKSSLKKKILLACGSFVFTLLLLEIALSTYSFFFYPRLVVTDAPLGWKYSPTAKPLQRHDRGGQVNTISINSQGFRDSEFATDSDSLRIMFLGDSMTFGLEADQQEIYPVLVEQMLQEKLGNLKIDVMNFGITGFNNMQELMCLREYEPVFHPQVILLQMTEWNDFNGNTWIYHGRYLPHTLLKNGTFVEENNPSTFYKFLNILRDHSALYFLLTHKTEELLMVTQDLTHKQEIELTLYILGQIHQYAQDKGLPFYLIYVRDPEHPTDRYEAIEEFVEEQGIPFRKIPVVPEERVAGIGHWNAQGHRHAAEITTEMLLGDGAVASHSANSDQN